MPPGHLTDGCTKVLETEVNFELLVGGVTA